ncbi:hypothetical protein LINGRAHAP2_LOCUS17671 [Linum grandiflorum]
MTEDSSSEQDVPLSSLGREVNAVNLISKLGEDLLVEILIRLPNPKSSCRCKAVCKPWRSIISDPSFNRRFIAHHQMFIPSHDPQSILSFLPVPDNARPNLRVFDCFKDLLLCGFADETFGELERSYLVCNPFTKQWIALPLAPITLEIVYNGSAAVLVCQPCSNYKPESAGFVYSEYRFRVVRLLQFRRSMSLEVFCSESGEWTQWMVENSIKMPSTNVVWWNEQLFWMHYDASSRCSEALGYNPFRPDVPPDDMSVPSTLWNRLCYGCGNFSISQGDFHIVVLEVQGVDDGLRNALSVWRVEVEDGQHLWIQRYEILLTTTPSPTSSSRLWGEYELDKCSVLCLHPENPEVVFFKYLDDCVFSFNSSLGAGEPELLSAVRLNPYEPNWRALQPRASFWPTRIPRYDDLRGMYDGSYECWVQTTPRHPVVSWLLYILFQFLVYTLGIR